MGFNSAFKGLRTAAALNELFCGPSHSSKAASRH